MPESYSSQALLSLAAALESESTDDRRRALQRLANDPHLRDLIWVVSGTVNAMDTYQGGSRLEAQEPERLQDFRLIARILQTVRHLQTDPAPVVRETALKVMAQFQSPDAQPRQGRWGGLLRRLFG